MTATNHALTGAAIATLIRQPLLAIPIAFASHFFCDALPHFGMKLKFGSRGMWTYLYAEAFAMLILMTFLLISGTEQAVAYLVVGSLVAMSPDLAWYVYGKKGKLGKPEKYSRLNKIHSKIQWSETKWGIIPELFWATFMMTIILK